MPTGGHEALKVKARIAEGRFGFRCGQFNHRRKLGRGVDPLHAAPSPTGDRLDENGPADTLCHHPGLSERCNSTTGNEQHASGFCTPPRFQLVADASDLFGGRTDEYDPGLLALACEAAILREKTVARINRICVDAGCGLQKRLDLEIALAGLRRSDAERAVLRGAPERNFYRPVRPRAPFRYRVAGTSE